jgi:hypothetical protein
VERLESKSRSTTFVKKASEELSGIKEIPIEEAEELVFHYIHQVVDAFQSMDDILADINEKNSKYQRAAINRAKFYLIGGEDVRGQLKEIISAINNQINQENMELGGIYRIEFLEELIRLYQVSVIDDNSLYTPIEGRKNFEPTPISDSIPDYELREEKMRKMLEKLSRVMNPDKINRYVDEQLGEQQNMKASKLPISSTDEFVKLIYIRLYGQRKNMHYQISLGEEVNVDGYCFRDFTISRKEHK